MTSPYILLPPSEGKVTGGTRTRRVGRFDSDLAEPRELVTKALSQLLRNPTKAATVMKVRGALLERAMMTATAHCAGEGAFLPAWQRYEGVVWKHLDPATLAASMRQRILVPSGLYGITTATDEIEDYRLTMNVALAPLGTVATFWRPFITEVIRSTRGPIVSFLPNEHLASIDLENEALRRRITHVAFVQPGSAKAVGHDAKAVKGVLARAVLEGGIAALEGFTWAGWTSSFVDGAWRVVAPRTRQLGK